MLQINAGTPFRRECPKDELFATGITEYLAKKYSELGSPHGRRYFFLQPAKFSKADHEVPHEPWAKDFNFNLNPSKKFT
jgi:hypothetical protein